MKNEGGLVQRNTIGSDDNEVTRQGICFIKGNKSYVYIEEDKKYKKYNLELGGDDNKEFTVSFYMKPTSSDSGTKVVINKGDKKL